MHSRGAVGERAPPPPRPVCPEGAGPGGGGRRSGDVGVRWRAACGVRVTRVTDLPLASARSDMIGWSRVLLSHTLDAARSY